MTGPGPPGQEESRPRTLAPGRAGFRTDRKLLKQPAVLIRIKTSYHEAQERRATRRGRRLESTGRGDR